MSRKGFGRTMADAIQYENESLGDLRRKFIVNPIMQSRVSVNPSEAVGSMTLAWYRGRIKGEHDAYLALRERFPSAAKFLLKTLGMNADGSKQL